MEFLKFLFSGDRVLIAGFLILTIVFYIWSAVDPSLGFPTAFYVWGVLGVFDVVALIILINMYKKANK